MSDYDPNFSKDQQNPSNITYDAEADELILNLRLTIEQQAKEIQDLKRNNEKLQEIFTDSGGIIDGLEEEIERMRDSIDRIYRGRHMREVASYIEKAYKEHFE